MRQRALSRLEDGQHINPTWNTRTRSAGTLGKEVALALRDVLGPAMAAGKRAAVNGAAQHAKKAGRRRKKTARG